MIAIKKDRIITNRDIASKNEDSRNSFVELGIDPSANDLEISSKKLIIIDPIYLSDIYNENGEKERYLKTHGILLMDFGGDVSGPILRTQGGGIKMLLVYDREDSNYQPIYLPGNIVMENEEVLQEALACDSGSYIFVDYNKAFCRLFQQELDKNKNNLALLEMPNGKYLVGYEQWETNDKNPQEEWRRNLIVLPLRAS